MSTFEETGRVTLVGGIATFRYKIKEPNHTEIRQVDCVVSSPINKNNVMMLQPTVIIPIETFTISGVLTGNNAIFTVRSNLPTSTTIVNLTVVEYRPDVTTPIKSVTPNVTLINGTGTYIYAVVQTQPSAIQKVKGQLTSNALINSEVTIPKYIPPYVPPPSTPYVPPPSTPYVPPPTTPYVPPPVVVVTPKITINNVRSKWTARNDGRMYFNVSCYDMPSTAGNMTVYFDGSVCHRETLPILKGSVSGWNFDLDATDFYDTRRKFPVVIRAVATSIGVTATYNFTAAERLAGLP